MTKIIFDLKRDNGYGKMVYGNGSLQWNSEQNSVDIQSYVSSIIIPINGAAVEFEIKPTDETFHWVVTEGRITSGGTVILYERKVIVPDSAEPINYLDLEDVDPITITA